MSLSDMGGLTDEEYQEEQSTNWKMTKVYNVYNSHLIKAIGTHHLINIKI